MSTVWSSTNSPLIRSGSEETSGVRRSTTESSPTSEGTSTDWPGSGDEPSTTVEEPSVLTDDEDIADLRRSTEEQLPDTGEETKTDWPGTEDLFNTGSENNGTEYFDEDEEISLKTSLDEDLSFESSMRNSRFANIGECPCECVASQQVLHKAVCDCFEEPNSGQQRCDMRPWHCKAGTYIAGPAGKQLVECSCRCF